MVWPESVRALRTVSGYITSDLIHALHPECVTDLDLYGRMQWAVFIVPAVFFGVLAVGYCVLRASLWLWLAQCSTSVSRWVDRTSQSVKQTAFLILLLLLPWQVGAHLFVFEHRSTCNWC